MNINKTEKQFALVCGNRIKRQDSMTKKISSKVANKIRKIMLDDDCDDTACALKVFSKDDYLKLKYFRNMHRFLPALLKLIPVKYLMCLLTIEKELKVFQNIRFIIDSGRYFRLNKCLVNGFKKEKKMSTDQIWLIVGFIGQTVFASRFLIQWIVSERASKSIIPNIFWWISLAGSMILLSYAIHKLDPVL